MARFELSDDGVVVIIGSGAGGGTLAHELTRRGIKVVLLEAGKRESIASFTQDANAAFAQLSWLDPRTSSGEWAPAKTNPGLPAWLCKTVGGTTTHWGAVTPRMSAIELRARTSYGAAPGHLAHRLADRARRAAALLRARRRAHVHHAARRQSRPAGFEQLQGHARTARSGRATSACTAAMSRSIRAPRTAAASASSRASACRAARWARSGARCTRRFRAPKPPASWICASSRWQRASNTAPTDASTPWCIAMPVAPSNGRRRAPCASRAMRSRRTRLLLLSESGKFPHGLANSSDQVGRNYCHHVLELHRRRVREAGVHVARNFAGWPASRTKPSTIRSVDLPAATTSSW